MSDDKPYVVDLSQVTLDMIPLVGGKNASLGEMIQHLGNAGVRVPGGFALTVHAYWAHLDAAGLTDEIQDLLDDLDVENVTQLQDVGRRIRKMILDAPLPDDVADEARAAYQQMCQQSEVEQVDVAVRSSATAEDLPNASFAGQQETYLNVSGWTELERAIRACMASLFTDRAIVYREDKNIPHSEVALSVGIQKMVRSDESSSGVIFTLDTESGYRDVVLITGAWGLGEMVVQGRVDPDEFWVHKPTLAQGFRPIIRKELGSKQDRMVYGKKGAQSTRVEKVPRNRRLRFVLDDDEVLQLAKWAVAIEDYYSKRGDRSIAMDLEWAKDGEDGDIYIVQARPETVHSQVDSPQLDLYQVDSSGHEVLITGKSVGRLVATGTARVVHDVSELDQVKAGDILVTEMTDPDWEPVLARCGAVVTDHGGRTCHAAIVSREIGIPCVVGTGRATSVIEPGTLVTVSCAEGDEGRVYDGEVPFKHEQIDPAELPTPRVPLMMNLANPDMAFELGLLPSAGVGLLRIEFLVNNWIGVHPMALVHPERIPDEEVRAEVLKKTRRYPRPRDFFVDRMASGVATIAAGFYPRPVIVRFSDFKTNEYARLLGGASFEPSEHNPMIGFRGASRYYDSRYREGFALECDAIRRVRDEMGLTNVKVMIPFCRTLEEGRRVLDVMKEQGLGRGDNGLEVYVMCEIPNNVLLADQFAELFDGFSIGSNDLTQLTLGVDRDSEILAELFDERDPGVKKFIRMVVEAAHQAGRKVGICGQAPSDYPDFAEFLADLEIDTISLTPDALPQVARRIPK